ncbi:hypothetical protein BG015_009460 [Linnemannia schmuckeri]|uniref:Uncharacterized protein n=1 Tax=Linnemannia schmuckeri TaxID=64567 RepID=A0A9P5V9C3_9FUNG|nr:hypothetical protein BG015_009460 [Linnemannia schmuckeri]
MTVDSMMLPLLSYCSEVEMLSFRIELRRSCDNWDDERISGPGGQRFIAQLHGMPNSKTIIVFEAESSPRSSRYAYPRDELVYFEFNIQGAMGPNSVWKEKLAKKAEYTLEDTLDLM